VYVYLSLSLCCRQFLEKRDVTLVHYASQLGENRVEGEVVKET
jgi:hypothetical protein